MVTAVLVVIALMGTVFASTMWLTAGRRSPAGEDAGRRWLAALEAHATEARARLDSLAHRSTSLEAHLGPLSQGWKVRRPSAAAAPPRPTESAHAERALVQLGSALVLPGTRVEPLRAGAGASGARGWLIRDVLHGRLFVYAAGLPRLVAPWDVRIAFGDTERRLPLRRMIDGSLWAILDRVDDSACTVRVAIVPPSGDRTVLAGDLACRAAPRA